MSSKNAWRSEHKTPSLPEVHRSVAVPTGASIWRKLFAFAGPGYLVAVGYMDPGNWATDIAGGSQFSHILLSVILISIVQSDQMGSGLAQVLRVQAMELRDKHRQRMREKAYRIPIKLLFPMILIFITLFTMTLGPAFLQLSTSIREDVKTGRK